MFCRFKGQVHFSKEKKENMLKSMTGYGLAQGHTDAGIVEVIARSVNSRFLDLTASIADGLPEMSLECNHALKARLSRGKVDLSINLMLKEPAKLTLNEPLLQDLIAKITHISTQLQAAAAASADTASADAAPVPASTLASAAANDAAYTCNLTHTAMALLQYPGMLKAQHPDATRLKEQILDIVFAAIDKLDQSRCTEGEAIRCILNERLKGIELQLHKIAPQLESLIAIERERICKRLMQLKVDLPTERLEYEVALQAQKADIAEEYDRLLCHVKNLRQLLQDDGTAAGAGAASSTASGAVSSAAAGRSHEAMGKRLDFIIQELMRECNTLGSKASTNELSQIAVELKVLVEQMREQVQNIE